MEIQYIKEKYTEKRYMNGGHIERHIKRGTYRENIFFFLLYLHI